MKRWHAGGTWDEKWVVDGVPRAAGVNSGRLDMYYISPDGKRMRSMSEVYQFLGLTAAAPKSTRPVTSPQMVDAPRSSREAKIFATAAISGAPPVTGCKAAFLRARCRMACVPAHRPQLSVHCS